MLAPIHLQTASARGEGIGNDLFREIHHRLVIAIRLIDFKHRKFRIVLGANSFIPIDAAEFVNPLKATHQQPFEVQLQCNPHEEGNIERVVVCIEGTRGSPTRDGVECGAFNFYKILFIQGTADRTHDPRTVQKTLAHALGIHQVEITHPLPQLRIGHPMMFIWRWKQ